MMAAPRFRVATLLVMIRRYSPETLIDLGCGGGQLLAAVNAKFPAIRLWGMDISQQLIESNRANKTFAKWELKDLDRSGTFQPELAGKFDTVVAMEIIEHLDHPEVFLTNALTLARPGTGRLFLSTQSGPVLESARRVGHQRHFSTQDIQRLLSATGWKPRRIWRSGFPFHDLSVRLANLKTDWTMRRFGSDRYGWFEKAISFGLRLAFVFNSKRYGAQLFAIAERPP